jgi:hypothetical protein
MARQLHRNASALKALCDRQDDLLRGKTHKRPRWSIFISGLPGPSRKYLFLDNDATSKYPELGNALHYDGPLKAFTSFSDPEAAIIFCQHLNSQEETK